MRATAYVIAVLAAVGVMTAIVTMPTEKQSVADSAANAQPAVDQVAPVSADKAATAESGTLTLDVPDMHCPFVCYPTVKKTLEGNSAVAEVQLTPQKVEGTIDNPQVIVTYDPGFDIQSAMAELEKKGFASKIVE